MEAAETLDGTAVKPRRDWRIYSAGTLGAILLFLLFFWFFLSGPKENIRELLVQSRDHYEERHESIPALAKSLKTVEAAMDFAQNRIAVSIYEGRLQSPEEVLITQIANPADKAMFAKALLDELGVATISKASSFPEDARLHLVPESEVAEKSLPDSLLKLMQYIGYQGDDIQSHIKDQSSLASSNLHESKELVDQALLRAGGLADLTGQSSIQPVYLDWVWLEGNDGKIYDPVLPKRARPAIFRSFSASVPTSRFSLTAVNAYGETKEMVAWEGRSLGKPISVSFVPAIDTAGRLQGDPDMSDIELWTPVLSVGNDHELGAAVNRQGDVGPKELLAAMVAEGGTPTFSAPPVSDLTIRAVDVSNWPRVKLALSAAVQGTPRWQGAHFSASIAENAPTVRIEQPFSVQKNVIILADQSGSTLENSYHQWIREFGKTLALGLSTKQRYAIATFGSAPAFHKLFVPGIDEKGYAKTAVGNAWKQPVRGQVDFAEALDHALNAVMAEFGAKPDEETQIILTTDGKAGQLVNQEWIEKLAAIEKRAKSLNVAINLVIMGASEDSRLVKLSQETGGKLIRVTDESSVVAKARMLANELAGGMVVSFKMPLDPAFDVGETIPVSLKLEGFDGEASSAILVPEKIEEREPGIYLNVSIGQNTTSRPIVALGEKYDFQNMIGQHEIYLAAGRYSTNQVIAGRLNNWITYFDIKADNQKKLEEAAQSRRVSVAQMQTINGLTNMVRFGLPIGQNVRFPQVVIKRSYTKVAKGAGKNLVEIINQLDAPAWVPLTANVAAKNDVARAGLLLNDAESRFNNGGENLTRMFVEAGSVAETSPNGNVTSLIANSSLRAGEDSKLFTQANTANIYWHNRQNTGQWRGFGIWDGVPLKGSRDVQTAAYFAGIQSAIGAYKYSVKQSAALGSAIAGVEATAVMPAAVGLGGFIAFKSEELKLWCYSTIMLGYVNESIADEKDAILDKSAKAAESRAAKLCKMIGGPQDFGKNAFKAAAKGFMDEWANQFEMPQAKDPTAGIRDAVDKASRIYKHYYPDVKKGEKSDSKDRLQKLVEAIDKYGNGDDPTLQTSIVDKAFKWGTSSFSPKFQQNLKEAISVQTN